MAAAVALRGAVLTTLVLSTSLGLAGVAAAAPNDPPPNHPTAEAAASAERCMPETHSWAGVASLGAERTSLATDLTITAGLGVRLEVVGVSADGIDSNGVAHALGVSIGGVDARPAVTVSGGAVTVHAATQPVVEVTGVTVVLLRCDTVSVLPPVAPSTSDLAQWPDLAQRPAVATADVSATPAQLPATGASTTMALAALAVTAVGCGLLGFGRRSSRAR